MAITKERKDELVAQYRELVEKYPSLILASTSGLTVKQLEGLRTQVREAGGEFRIVKNTLIKLVFDEAGIDLPEGTLIGPTAIGFSSEGVVSVTKAIVDLAKETKVVELKPSIVDGAVYQQAQLQKLADLPPMPVVQSQLLSVLQAPATKMAGVLASSVRQVVNVVKAYSETEAAPA
ncbi:MAG: 50S ribosomal protein L10 [Anaerolineales bacterium]